MGPLVPGVVIGDLASVGSLLKLDELVESILGLFVAAFAHGGDFLGDQRRGGAGSEGETS